VRNHLHHFKCGCVRAAPGTHLRGDVPLPLPRCAVYLQAWPGAHEDWSRWMAFLKEHFSEENRVKEEGKGDEQASETNRHTYR